MCFQVRMPVQSSAEIKDKFMSQKITQTIEEMQFLYAQCQEVVEQLQRAQQEWQEGLAKLDSLAQFYFSDQWLDWQAKPELWQEIDTQGQYSVMSEDAIWNLLHEQRQLAIRWLRLAVEVLEKE